MTTFTDKRACEDSGFLRQHCECPKCGSYAELVQLIHTRRTAKARVMQTPMDERLRDEWLADLDADIRRYEDALA